MTRTKVQRRSLDDVLSQFGELEHPTLVDEIPNPRSFRFELKYDGYRILAAKVGDEVRLVSRRGADWTADFPSVADAIRALSDDVVFDGEICAIDDRGAPSFQRLQNRKRLGRDQPGIIYAVFDLLAYRGTDLRALPIEQRTEMLAKALPRQTIRPPLAVSSAVQGDPDEVLELARRLGFEGIVAKRKGSRYRPGRSTDWLKRKAVSRQEFVVCGYVPYAGTVREVGSLLVGLYGADGALHYAGKVGTGYDGETRRALGNKLEASRRASSALIDPPRIKEAHWCEPRLVAEVQFTEWTAGGLIRHPSFIGLRADKAPAECARERPSRPLRGSAPEAAAVLEEQPKTGGRQRSEVAGVSISHPARVFYPSDGITKLELAQYFEMAGPWMVPHVKGRPLTLVRCPASIEKCAFMRHLRAWRHWPALRIIKVPEQRKVGEYLVADNTAALVSLLQMDIIEIHTWNSTDSELEFPNRVVFDLDPDESLRWTAVVKAARQVRELLQAHGLTSWVKTTGGKGLHVVVPLAPTATWSACLAFTRSVAQELARDNPRVFTASVAKAARAGKIFVDYLRNGRGNSSVSAFSPRARPGAPVSVPLDWDELEPRRTEFTLRTVIDRLKRQRRDPWLAYFHHQQRLPKSRD